MTPNTSFVAECASVLENFSISTETLDSSNSRRSTARTRSAPGLPRSHARSPSDSGFTSELGIDPKSMARGRSLDKDLEHKLHEAVSSIQQRRSGSPEDIQASLQAADPFVAVPTVSVVVSSSDPSPSRQICAKLGHTKSMSEAQAALFPEASCAIESDADESIFKRPHRMVRKKSGELVRSSLKSGSRRPASMPSTPVFTKNVKFDRKLEHIRHFLHSEKPTAVSANTSPIQEYATNSDFPFRRFPRKPMDEDFELSIDLPNFIPEAQQTSNDGAIIKVETVYLSPDKTSLIGRVAVRNLAFHKNVWVRYTMDNWRTTSDTAAEYTEDVRKKQRDDPFDRFLFRIKIDDFTGVTDKTMFFCVKYHTAGQDFWDSNGGQNFRVEFHGRYTAERRHSDPTLMAPIRRPSSDEIDIKDDEIELTTKTNIPALKSPRSLIFENIYDNHPESNADDVDHDKPVKTRYGARRGTPGDSFSNRYDFGASLTAAIAAANSMLQGSGDEIRPKKHLVEHVEPVKSYNPYFEVKPAAVSESSHHMHGTTSPSFPPGLDSSEYNSPASSGNVSPIPGIQSKSNNIHANKDLAYQDLLNNYCFPKTARPMPSIPRVDKPYNAQDNKAPPPFMASPYDTPPYSTSPPMQGSPIQGNRSTLNASPINFSYDTPTSGASTPIKI